MLSATKEKKVTLNDVERLTGAPPSELVNGILQALGEKDLEKGLLAVKQAADRNTDMKVFMKLILHRMRAVLLLRYAKEMAEVIRNEVSVKDFIFLEKLAKDPVSGINAAALQGFLVAYEQVGRSYIPHLPLELALINLLNDTKQSV